ncbi:pectin acetylesterase-family hydrolase [Vitiosangium sp. GDMCC 1.1324]|uniref:pectin acetylesterase-family hydrolase n=1 Tax=Vitiosangium sp. (strain GDMCC 1.1324) TaxID=2138576 RepID=UPI00130EEB1D|nr:pectin acetylesterase-family hydrolase [Vitiosangium sp. GDMCC 1.1324]
MTSVSAQESVSGTAQCAVPPVQLTHTSTVTNDVTVRVVPKSVYPLAICNDGTPATYLFRPGVGAGAKRWLIYLEGGGSCSTAADCQERYKKQRSLMSSGDPVDHQPFTTPLEGIKSPLPGENPDFYDANFVQLIYCSSDSWSGDRAGNDQLPTGDLARWHFRGRRILEAVFTELQSQGFSSAEEVFLLGSSAGGVGVMNNVDAVHARLPASVRFVALMDAGFIIDYPAYDLDTHSESTAIPTTREQELATTATVWAARGDWSCEAAATDATSKLMCRSPEKVIGGGYISSPLFIRQSQADGVQLKGLIPPSENDANANAYRQRFTESMRARLSGLQQVAVFAPLDTEHGVINDTDEWNASIVNGTLLPAAIGAWYRDPCNSMLQRIEQP